MSGFVFLNNISYPFHYLLLGKLDFFAFHINFAARLGFSKHGVMSSVSSESLASPFSLRITLASLSLA